MKTIKTLMVFLALCVGFQISAQTWAYKMTYSVKDGVKKKVTRRDNIRYLTFVDNKRKCYWSDENGYKVGGCVYDFIGTENGVHIYSDAREISHGAKHLESYASEMYFSNDFKRMNYKDSFLFNIQGITVYQYVENPLKEKAPKQLY